MPVKTEAEADWVLRTLDDQDIFLSQAEYDLLKKASFADKKMVWFRDLTIAMSQIATIQPVRRKLPQPRIIWEVREE